MKKITFKNLPDKTAPISANNLNQLQNNVEEAILNPVVESIKSENQFDKDDCVDYYYLDYNNGQPVADINMSYMKSYIPVKPNEKYTMSYSSSTIFVVYEYDSNKTFLRNKRQNTDATSFTVTISEDAYFVRLACGYGPKSGIVFTLGDTAVPYTPYKRYGYNSQESMGSIVVDDISCKNKFNKYGSLSDYRQYSSGTTTLESNGKIKATANIVNGNGKGQIIQLKPNTTYTFSAKIDSVEVAGSTTFRILKVLGDDTAPNDGKVLEETTEAIAGKTYTYQFTTGETGKIWLTLNGINNNDYNIFKYVIYDNIQIEEGTDTTNYSEYKGIGYTSGQNENGHWVKYDDGRMECFGELLYENVAIINADYGTYYAQLDPKPFAMSFKSNPICVMQVDSVAPGYALWLRSTDTGSSKTKTNRLLVTSMASCTANKIKIHYHAYGYWK